MGELNTAARVRQAVAEIVAKTLARERPLPRMAKVTAIDFANRKVTCEFPDEAGTTFVAVCGSKIPSAVNQWVRIAGPPGDRYVDDVLGQPATERGGASCKALVSISKAACSSTVSGSTATTATDITGATVTITGLKTGDLCDATGVFDVVPPLANGTNTFVGTLWVTTGGEQLEQALKRSDSASTNERQTVSQSWLYTIPSDGDYTFKLQGRMTQANGNWSVNQQHTHVIVRVFR